MGLESLGFAGRASGSESLLVRVTDVCFGHLSGNVYYITIEPADASIQYCMFLLK